MKLSEVQIIRSTLGPVVGWSWITMLLRSMLKKKRVFGKTRWSNLDGDEAKFAKRMSIAPAIYLELEKRVGKKRALEATHELLVSTGCSEQWNHLNSLDLGEMDDMERLVAFNSLMDRVGTPRFNKREYLKHDADTCHFIITRCVFSDFFTEVGTPELTRAFCEVDRRFFPEAFPGLRFHRSGPWENTIAYGRDHCEFVFERIERG